MTPFEIFAPELRKLGFRKEWSSVAGGVRVHQWRRDDKEELRTVIVQIWGDPQFAHRASHEHCGCDDTYPTDFTTVDGLKAAVAHEAARMDSEFRPGGTKGSWNRAP